MKTAPAILHVRGMRTSDADNGQKPEKRNLYNRVQFPSYLTLLSLPGCQSVSAYL